MEFKGTKDDWIADYSHESETYISCNGLRIAEVKHYKHYDLNDPSTEEGRANAKLMVASPKLLKALLFLKQEYEKLVDCGDCGSWNPRQDNCVVLAKEAINEALN
jgi:hypothetical protein